MGNRVKRVKIEQVNAKLWKYSYIYIDVLVKHCQVLNTQYPCKRALERENDLYLFLSFQTLLACSLVLPQAGDVNVTEALCNIDSPSKEKLKG